MNYFTTIKAWRCLKCGHTWVNRKPGEPKRCGKCKRWDWKNERKPAKVKGEKNKEVRS